MIYGEEVPAKLKYYNAGLFVIIGTIYWGFTRIIFLYIMMGIDFVFWEILPYAGIIFLLSYLFWIGPLQKTMKAQEIASEPDFMDSLIQKGKSKPHDLMLGFKEVYEVKIDFKDDTSLNNRLNSQFYKHYLYRTVLKQVEENKENQIETPQEFFDFLKKLENSIKQGTLPLKAENNPKKDNPEIDQEVLTEELRNLEKDTTALLKLNKSSKNIIIHPYTQFKLETIKNKAEFKESIELLAKQKYYYVKLYTKENFKNEKEEWDEMFIILPAEYSKVCETHPDETVLDGWWVNVKLCFCFWTYWWSVATMPVLCLNFSDKMAKKNIDLLTKMNAEAMAYLELKVMDMWMNELLVRPEKIIKQNTYLESKVRTFEHGFSDLIQDQADTDLKYSQFFRDKAQNTLLKKIEKYKRGIIAIFSVLIFVLILGGIVLSFII